MSGFRSLDNAAPTMPPHTCPAIDRAIVALRSIGKDLAYASRHCEYDDTTDAIEAIERAVDNIDLEPLRQQNEELRDCATWWRAQAEELCAQIERLEAEAE